MLGALVWLLGGAAFAGVPTTLTHQGRLLDANGDPLTGPHTVRVGLWSAETGGTERWSETNTGTDVDNGYFSIVLGRVEPIDSDVIDGPVWVELTVDQGAPLPRRELHSVPYAILAHGVRGGVVDASEIRVDGQVVIDGTGQIAWDAIDVPTELQNGDDDTLRDLTCAEGQSPAFASGQWTCADAPPPVTWTTLGGVPADLSDGDQVGLTAETDPSVNALGKATLACTAGQIAAYDGASWTCTAPPAVNALGTATLTCTAGQIAAYDGSTWRYADDGGVTTETDPTVNPLAKATLSCTTGQGPRWNGTAWGCATLFTTESDPSVNTLGKAQLDCQPGQVPRYFGGTWSCTDALAIESDPSVNALGKATLACAATQVPRWNGSVWACSTALTTEVDPSVNLLGRSTLNCGEGQVAKKNNTGWVCADDEDTTYSAGTGIAITGAGVISSTVNPGGTCYTKWGNQTCASGFTAVVTGRAGGFESYSGSGGTQYPTLECVSDSATVKESWGSSYATRMMRADNDAFGMVGVSSQCAICCTGGCYDVLGSTTCAAGYTRVVSGHVGGVEAYLGGAHRGKTLCIDDGIATRHSWATEGHETRLMRHVDVATNGNSGGMQSVTNTCATCCR